MSRIGSGRFHRAWKGYTAREGEGIEQMYRAQGAAGCPRCGGRLAESRASRVSPCVVLDARAYDLSCRACRRFWCVVQHTPRSRRLLRMRRLAAAVRAVEPDVLPLQR